MAFEKRRDHGVHKIVSVPVPETSFFLPAADERKGRDAKRSVRAAFMSYARERGTNVGCRVDGETKMREIDGSDERRTKEVKDRERQKKRGKRAEDVEIKRGTEEDCEGARRGERRGRVKWVHLRSVKQSGLRIEPGSGPA